MKVTQARGSEDGRDLEARCTWWTWTVQGLVQQNTSEGQSPGGARGEQEGYRGHG